MGGLVTATFIQGTYLDMLGHLMQTWGYSGTHIKSIVPLSLTFSGKYLNFPNVKYILEVTTTEFMHRPQLTQFIIQNLSTCLVYILYCAQANFDL